VQAAVRRGIRPSASPVAATAHHPAGLVVTGWSAAGAGLVDGDIITSVGGRTPSAVEDVIAAVAGAYKAETYAVSGRVWRNGETFPVTVELPIPGNSANKPRAQYLAPRSTGGP
jgi:S1-C subfamily serine protease